MSIKDFFFNQKAKAALNKHGQSDPREAAYDYLESKLEKAFKKNDDKLLKDVLTVFMKRLTISINNSIKDEDDKTRIKQLLTINKEKVINIIKDFIKNNIVISPHIEILEKLIGKEKVLDFLNSILDTEDTLFNEDIVEKKIEILKHFEGVTYEDVMGKAIIFLDDTDDNLVIAAIRFLKEYDYNTDEEEQKIQSALLEKLADEETSSRIRMELLEVFLLNDWAVSGFKKRIESLLPEEYYLTSKGKIRKIG